MTTALCMCDFCLFVCLFFLCCHSFVDVLLRASLSFTSKTACIGCKEQRTSHLVVFRPVVRTSRAMRTALNHV